MSDEEERRDEEVPLVTLCGQCLGAGKVLTYMTPPAETTHAVFVACPVCRPGVREMTARP